MGERPKEGDKVVGMQLHMHTQSHVHVCVVEICGSYISRDNLYIISDISRLF